MSDYTQLSMVERCKISARIKKQPVSAMAKELNRHRSTLYREMKRNKINAIYDPIAANRLAKDRRAGGAKSRFETNPELEKYVIEKLQLCWSPEEISGRMKQEAKSFSICTESIYQFVYRDPEKNLYKLLPEKRKKRISRHQRRCYTYGVKSQIIADHNIKNRPPEAASREQPGHWEGDTIRFPKDQKHNATTLVERVSRFTIIEKNLDGKTNTVIGAICDIIKKSQKHIWKSITFDQGKEFMAFSKIEHSTSCQAFFCDPHSPWQRPTNENTNGRIRRFLPKDAPIDTISSADLQVICDRMNDTPRKCLGYQTPREVFMQLACRT
jgi:IS30 family transposase